MRPEACSRSQAIRLLSDRRLVDRSYLVETDSEFVSHQGAHRDEAGWAGCDSGRPLRAPSVCHDGRRVYVQVEIIEGVASNTRRFVRSCQFRSLTGDRTLRDLPARVLESALLTERRKRRRVASPSAFLLAVDFSATLTLIAVEWGARVPQRLNVTIRLPRTPARLPLSLMNSSRLLLNVSQTRGSYSIIPDQASVFISHRFDRSSTVLKLRTGIESKASFVTQYDKASPS